MLVLVLVLVVAFVFVAAIVVSYYVGVDFDVGVGSSFASLDYLPGFDSSKFLHLVVIVAAFSLWSFHIDNVHLPLDIN